MKGAEKKSTVILERVQVIVPPGIVRDYALMSGHPGG